MTNKSFAKWFETFLSEKNLPIQSWEIETPSALHLIDTDTVIESIKNTHITEQIKIKDIIVKIDFANGDVNHFFKHLATGLAHNY